MINPEDIFRHFKRDPKQDARIMDSIMPNEWFPKAGDYFRVRTASIPDRSYMGDIWLCVESQEYCAVGRKVMDTYCGTESKHVGQMKSFVLGDVIFYDCTKIWAAVVADKETRQPNESEVPPSSGSDE